MSKLTDFFPQSTSGSSISDANALNADVYANIIVVGGGGGGSTTSPSQPSPSPYVGNSVTSAGAAGGYFCGRYGLSLGVEYPVVIGAAGAAAPSTVVAPTSFGGRGGNTLFDNGRLTGYGGGGGGSFCRCNVPSWSNPYINFKVCSITIPGTPGGLGGFGCPCGLSIQCASRFGCHSNACNPLSPLNGLALDFTGNCVLCPGACGRIPNANTGIGGISVCTPGTACSGSSGFVVISYPVDMSGAASSTPGAVNCSPQTPGYYTYVYTSTGSFKL